LSRYIWRGFDVYSDDHSAIQPSINIDLYRTGFGLTVFSSRANGGGFENCEELDITLYYYNNLFEGETYAANYRFGWVYYNYPDSPRKASDLQEVFTTLSWPNIFAWGIVPSYTVAHAWPSESSSVVSDNGGWAHVFGLGYEMALPGFIPDVPEQILHLSAVIVYNNGIGPGCPPSAGGTSVDHDWSHTVFGVSTDFNLSNNLIFTPAFYYQASMDDSVNTEDETWCGLSMRYKF
jgi:hypothetical protein